MNAPRGTWPSGNGGPGSEAVVLLTQVWARVRVKRHAAGDGTAFETPNLEVSGPNFNFWPRFVFGW